MKVENRQSYRPICGGSLISQKHILTAAHCMKFSNEPSDYLALLGHSRNNFSKQADDMYFVSKLILHQGYNKILCQHFNDIAIMVLTTSVELKTNIKVAKLEDMFHIPKGNLKS